MILIVGGVPDSEWTDEPRYPNTDEPIYHAEDCTEEDRATFCKVSWINYDDKKKSSWWNPCTF